MKFCICINIYKIQVVANARYFWSILNRVMALDRCQEFYLCSISCELICGFRSNFVYALILTRCRFGWLPYFAVYYAHSCIIRTWFLVSDPLEKVLFPCKIRGKFKASFPWCINSGISNSAENKPIVWEGTIYLGPRRLDMVRVDKDISSLVHKYRYIGVFWRKSAENKPILRERTIYLGQSWLGMVLVD